MILFFTSSLQEDIAILKEDEYQHCCKVLRKKLGDDINLTDGQGHRATGDIIKVNKQSAEIKLHNKSYVEPEDHKSHLYVCPPKNRARWEWLLEKAVELGITTITPLITYHTEKLKINEVRAQKIMRSAALQCLRNYHPRLLPSQTLKALLKKPSSKTDKFIASYDPSNINLINQKMNHQEAMILVGPEGDFSSEEIDNCKEYGFVPVNISSNRLRTETAAITAVNTLKLMGY